MFGPRLCPKVALRGIAGSGFVGTIVLGVNPKATPAAV